MSSTTKFSFIGVTPDDFGIDVYCVIEGVTTENEAEDIMGSAYYYDAEVPGARYCHVICVTPHPRKENCFIGYAQIRYDV